MLKVTRNAWADEFKNRRLNLAEARALSVIAAVGPIGDQFLANALGASHSQITRAMGALEKMGLVALSARGWVVTAVLEGEHRQ